MIEYLTALSGSIAAGVTGLFTFRTKKLEMKLKEKDTEIEQLKSLQNKVHAAGNAYIGTRELKSHHFFVSVNRMVENKIDTIAFEKKLCESEPEEINILRRHYFIKIMKAKWLTMAPKIKEFILDNDFNSFNKLEFKTEVGFLLSECQTIYRKALKEQELNDEIVNLFLRFRQDYVDFMFEVTERIMDSDTIYVNNNAKFYAVLDWLDISVDNNMSEIERFFKSLNGHFSKILKETENG